MSFSFSKLKFDSLLRHRRLCWHCGYFDLNILGQMNWELFLGNTILRSLCRAWFVGKFGDFLLQTISHALTKSPSPLLPRFTKLHEQEYIIASLTLNKISKNVFNRTKELMFNVYCQFICNVLRSASYNLKVWQFLPNFW